jgi:predicted site-specific integrase-resolvase
MKMLKIGKVAKMLGVSIQTLHHWEKTGELVPDKKTRGGTRYYDEEKLLNKSEQKKITLAYARVSSHDQKTDLVRQCELLEMFCIKKGWQFEIISDLGSGMNYRKKGLNQLLDKILEQKIQRLVLTHKDRLLRFGAELLFSMCHKQGIEVVIINQDEESSFEEELAKDVLEIITVFSARLYGSRSHKNKKLMKQLQDVIEK